MAAHNKHPRTNSKVSGMNRSNGETSGDESANDDISGNKNPVVTFLIHAIHAAKEKVGLDTNTTLALEQELESLVNDDPNMDRKVRELIMALKPVPIEPDKTLNLRASIRPTITKSLTFSFIALMGIWVLSGFMGKDVNTQVTGTLKDVLPIFLGVYGSVIGFWFGEHTALKQMQQNK